MFICCVYPAVHDEDTAKRRNYVGDKKGSNKDKVPKAVSMEPLPIEAIESETQVIPSPAVFKKRQSVAAEHYDPAEDTEADEANVVHPKSDAQRKRLNEAVKNILLFKSLDSEQMNIILDAMFERKVKPKEHVIDQGASGDNFYVIDSGKYDIFVKVDGADKKVGQYENRGFFGELALMYNMPRAATIIATTNGVLWAMDRKTFRKIVMKNAYKKRQTYLEFIDYVPMLKSLNEYERMNIADALHPKSFQDGEQIIKQGDSADCMYFVENGEVRITAQNEDVSEEVELTRLTRGAYFGELALITKNPRAANAYAVGPTKCAILDVEAFESLLGPCMDLMKRKMDDYQEQKTQINIYKKK